MFLKQQIPYILFIFQRSIDKFEQSISVVDEFSILNVFGGLWVLLSLLLLLKVRSYLIINSYILYIVFGITYFITLYRLFPADGQFQKPIVYSLLTSLFFLGFPVFLRIRAPEKVHNKDDFSNLNNKAKYQKTGLSDTYSKEIKDRLEYLMEREKLFLDPELRLDKIAELLHISRHHASQVINENFNMHFNDYVNTYRIEEVKCRLSSNFQNSSVTISEIAYSCGFNNRTSFYRAFKKITNLSPKEYIQKVSS